MHRRDFLRAAAAAAIGLAVPGWLGCRQETALRVGDVPSPAVLADLQGNAVVLPSAFLGRVAVIHFWASWCPLCRSEMSILESLCARHKGEGVIACSVGIGESREGAEAYLGSAKPAYPILLDRESTLVKPYGIAGIPTTYVLDRRNVVRHRILGKIEGEGLGRMIGALL